MVGSKDTKRKRKESPLPASQQAQTSSANIESSPEVPKRNKVQAQRKFAQGQSAPSSSYSSTNVTPSCSNGPNTSANRDPPIEILPNKRPKTDDFLTFLCFRGTSDLPPHLDFLNQGDSKNRGKKAAPVTKKSARTAKNSKQSKKGCAKGPAKVVSTPKNSKAAAKATGATSVAAEVNKPTVALSSAEIMPNNVKEKSAEHSSNLQDGDMPKSATMSFAVRKRAEQTPDGNRGGRSGRQLRNAKPTVNEKCNTVQETTNKRRSNRASTKEPKTAIDSAEDDVDDEEDEYFSAQDEVVKTDELHVQEVQNSKTEAKTLKAANLAQKQRPSNTSRENFEESKDTKRGSRATPVKKGCIPKDTNSASPTNSKLPVGKEPVKRGLKTDNQVAKDKPPPIKRPRQKESPIFIPSPEPSGRMTRQRAFFEPVKVPHRDGDVEEDTVKSLANDSKLKVETSIEMGKEEQKNVLNSTQEHPQISLKADLTLKGHGASDLKIFDFSSDDEQPLAKSIKMKATESSGKASPGKKAATGGSAKTGALATRVGRKTQLKATQEKNEKEEFPQAKKMTVKELKNERNIKVHITSDDMEEEEAAAAVTSHGESESVNKTIRTINTSKRGKVYKETTPIAKDPSIEKIVAQENVEQKKTTHTRQPRKRTKVNDSTQAVNGEEDLETTNSLSLPQTRNQRPTRKTKEAATIYMGIIGHKLQLADDEEDDLSLNSFPDLPNVKEVEKMEIELKKNASQATNSANKITNQPAIIPTQSSKTEELLPLSNANKPPTVRRGRPPKQTKSSLNNAPAKNSKRASESVSPKKGIDGNKNAPESAPSQKEKNAPSEKLDSDDVDFLLSKEVNVTKRNLAKSFSDSDDEPLAIKVQVKTSEKDTDREVSQPSTSAAQTLHTPSTSTPTGPESAAALALPLLSSFGMQKIVSTPPPASISIATVGAINASPTSALAQQQQAILSNQHPVASPFKSSEKKSPVPTSKILNVPATYGTPPPTNPVNVSGVLNAGNYGKAYLPQPPAPYHTPLVNVRPTATGHTHSQMVPVRMPSGAVPVGAPAVGHQMVPIPSQTPIKYQTPPTTYPPPIEAYPSPKINPNFLTPKFDRMSLPRSNNFPSPSPVKFDAPSTATTTSKAAMTGNSTVTATPKTQSSNTSAQAVTGAAVASTSAGADANSAVNIAELLKDNLMPSKEESGKIFGIASVSLAQSSGPDNTKCTLGKCGSIHKPVLGPVVPTEGYIGDQMSSKERRKAKVNMTHEQIQKWLIECSSNPDEIQDDLDEDFDDNLRPNIFATTPPPTRDDKESTSFSSSSKATRDLGKSESAWSTKGPSLKATPVVATVSKKEERQISVEAATNVEAVITSHDKMNAEQVVATIQKPSIKQNVNAVELKLTTKENTEKKTSKELAAKEDITEEKAAERSKKAEKEKELQPPKNTKAAAVTLNTGDTSQNRGSPSSGKQGNRKRNTTSATATVPSDAKIVVPASLANQSKTSQTATSSAPTSNAGSTGKTQKRTPVYNQKAQKQIELKETTTTSHRKSAPFSYGAFSADNEKSVYSFDKDDDDDEEENTSKSKPAFRRQSRRDSQPNDDTTTLTPTSRTSPAKKRAAAAAAERANKDLANASHNSSVSLTLSPAENCKLVKVSLDSEKPVSASTQATGPTNSGKTTKGNVKKTVESVDKCIAGGERTSKPSCPSDKKDVDSDSDGHTFYIPLQGSGLGKDNNGSIQGVAVKLGREGPDGPNQKVIMHATLVTKAQIGSEANTSPDIAKTLENALTQNEVSNNKKNSKANANLANMPAAASVSSSAAATSANTTPLGSQKNTTTCGAQSRFKSGVTTNPSGTTGEGGNTAASGSGLVRVNSNSSLLSGSAKSRAGVVGNAGASSQNTISKKLKDDTPIKMANNTAFPRHDDPTQMVEAPIFRPTEKEFADPIEFIERITPIAARFGICKIIPPSTFKPECRISDDMRFTAYNQYVHKMLHRWGPSAKELSAIKKYLATQSIVMNHPPWIGGMEVDLPRLYHTVQELGGLKEVIEKKKWARVAEEMCIPKLAQDRVTKLDDIYCKYLLPYDTLSPAERQKIFDEVEADWAKREARARRNADRFVNTESVSNEEDDDSTEDDEESEEEVDGVSMECIVKGRSMALNQFYRIARNTMALWFKNTEPTVNEVEAEFWRHVAVRDSHVCVHSGSIDSSGWGYGFPSPGPKGKGSNYARHPWNLKVLTNNPGSVLRSLGPVMGVTVPTLHVGMLFSACCWYRDPHGLSWIEYLHTGASKLWYGIPDDQSANFRSALTSLIPTHCQNKTIWLPCDTVMVPPHMLTDRGVSLCRIEQRPGEFIVVFPRAYTSSLSTGYVVSESVYFATTSWLDLAKDDFRDIHESCEPAMFSLEQLLFALGHDQRVISDTLEQMLPMLHEVCEKESAAREQLRAAGVTSTEMVFNEKGAKGKKLLPPVKSVESECDLCRANLYISMVRTDDGNVYCLQHALKNLNNGNIQAKQCKLIHAYNVDDIEKLIKVLNERILLKRNTASKKSK